ncbi:hypothetical protein [Massilia sp. TSP1-1-2]|uniref:hypothetical protein n=1 Tax=unclassified Massilia TaxID=2609279 RepID=UPI003CEEA82E
MLIVTAHAADASDLRRLLLRSRDGPFDIVAAGTLAASLSELATQRNASISFSPTFACPTAAAWP